MTVGHYCGLFGALGHDDAVMKTYYGLQALQHRGQEGAGIASTDGCGLDVYAKKGLVSEVFRKPSTLNDLAARNAIGHVRYSTTGGSDNPYNVQPLKAEMGGIKIALAHNGDLTNKAKLRNELDDRGALFQSTTDTETILHLLAASNGTLMERLREVLPKLQGAYSLLLLTTDRMIAIRDPRGFRPLLVGRGEGGVMFASESCAFDLFEVEDYRELEPGEILSVSLDGDEESTRFTDEHTSRVSQCIFEHVYFARPDSTLFGDNVHMVRMELGRTLAREHPADADLVTAVPDSGNSASIGFSQESGIRLDRGFIKNHYVGRTFIHPDPAQRQLKVALKINAVREVVEGKRVVVIDDSIIRGTTSLSRVKALRKAGAREIHMRISCPPTRYACFYGINFPTREELIANHKSVDEIRDFLEIESLGYLSERGLAAAMSQPADRYCFACFDGEYPCATPDQIGE